MAGLETITKSHTHIKLLKKQKQHFGKCCLLLAESQMERLIPFSYLYVQHEATTMVRYQSINTRNGDMIFQAWSSTTSIQQLIAANFIERPKNRLASLIPCYTGFTYTHKIGHLVLLVVIADLPQTCCFIEYLRGQFWPPALLHLHVSTLVQTQYQGPF